MRTVTLNIALGVVLTLFAVSPALALDSRTIDRWVDSMEELQSWADDNVADMEDDFSGEMDDPMNFDFEAQLARTAREHSRVESIIRDHGFSADEWANVGSRIFQAFMAVNMEGASAEMDAEMAEAMREMEESPHMTEEQKQMMRQQMQQAQQMMGSMGEGVSDSDRRAVEARMDRLNEFFDAD